MLLEVPGTSLVRGAGWDDRPTGTLQELYRNSTGDLQELFYGMGL